jgi:hypothetical protein
VIGAFALLAPGVAFPVSLGFHEYQASDMGGGDGIYVLGETYTLSLDQFVFYDSNGQPPSGYSLTSESGTVYSAYGAVPEPGSLALLLSAVGICFWTAYKRAKRASERV